MRRPEAPKAGFPWVLRRSLLFVALLGAVCATGALAAWRALDGRLLASVNGPKLPAAPRADLAAAAAIKLDLHITVDQFGWRPDDTKVAVIRNPNVGFDANRGFMPGNAYELRRADDGTVMFSGTPVAWNEGATQVSSGDQGWWFDFSSVKSPGRYFVIDVARGVRSPTFAIDAAVYAPVLKAAVRTYFYQRSGFAKKAPHAEACWTDPAAYVGERQDGAAHDVNDRDNANKVRDLSGGWFDAGDTNKYVTFAAPAVHQLLTAYTNTPSVFTDDFNIPESGNGLPDLIDEIKWETDWLVKMQNADGSFLLKVGEVEYVRQSPPSSDKSKRYYVPACSSATIAGAGMLAHAAHVYARFPALAADSAALKARAISAWDRFQRQAKKDINCDTGMVKAGDADLNEQEQLGTAVTAAAYLFALTGEPAYEAFIKAQHTQTRPYRDIGWSRYNADQGEALLFYAALPNADAELRRKILADKQRDLASNPGIYALRPRDDLYRAFLHDEQYTWGSHQVRANYGNSALDAKRQAAGADAAALRARALGILNYFHGVNPFATVALSNMYQLGATKSVDTLWHGWFAQKSKWSDARNSACGPAPGYLTGGPNAQAAQNGVHTGLRPPVGQPLQKSWLDFNLGDENASWVLNEPAIYYQAAYVKLLSEFVPVPQ